MRLERDERAITELAAVVELASGMCKMAFGVGLFDAETGGEPPGRLVVGLVEEARATGRVERVFEEIREREGERLGTARVPAFWRALAHRPGYLEAVWNRVCVIMAGGALSTREKEILAFAVAANAGSEYFVHERARALGRLEIGDAGIMEILGVVQYFDGLNRLTEGMDVESDIRPPAPAR